VGQVGNLRPIGGALWARPSAIICKCQHRLRLAAMRVSQSWLSAGFFESVVYTTYFAQKTVRAENAKSVLEVEMELPISST
jgi:hypothetical protein